MEPTTSSLPPCRLNDIVIITGNKENKVSEKWSKNSVLLRVAVHWKY